jgi:hypothetical protein
MKIKSPPLLLLLIIVSILSSCKKGADDPKISLRSRKARLAGEWRMKQGNAAITYDETGSTPYAQGFVFDGSSCKASQTYAGSSPAVYSFAYILNLNIKKDGSFVLTENYGGKTLKANGTWDFLKGVGEMKSKEEVIFRIESVDTDETVGHVFNLQGTTFTYRLLGLKNKELKMEAGTSEYLAANGNHFSYSVSYDFIQ